MKKSNWIGVALSVLVVLVCLVWRSADAQRPSDTASPVKVMNESVPIHASGQHWHFSTASIDDSFPVPAGKTLIIEYLNLYYERVRVTEPMPIWLGFSILGTGQHLYCPRSARSSDYSGNFKDTYVLSEMVKIYLHSGWVDLRFAGERPAQGLLQINIAGTLVNSDLIQ